MHNCPKSLVDPGAMALSKMNLGELRQLSGSQVILRITELEGMETLKVQRRRAHSASGRFS